MAVTLSQNGYGEDTWEEVQEEAQEEVQEEVQDEVEATSPLHRTGAAL